MNDVAWNSDTYNISVLLLSRSQYKHITDTVWTQFGLPSRTQCASDAAFMAENIATLMRIAYRLDLYT